jgi:hypothetical protein
MPLRLFPWWVRLLARLIMQSSSVGTIAIRKYNSPVHYVLVQRDDPFFADEDEPASMLLERLYHEPDAIR